MARRPLILLSNDDGYFAPGIVAARDAIADLGDVWIVAPDAERSSCSHAMTLQDPVFCRKIDRRTFAVGGTPGDAVFIAYSDILPRHPDLVVSGINRGPNLGKDVFYSGTVAAAREACWRGARSMAVSLAEGDDFDHAARTTVRIASRLLERRCPVPRNSVGGVLLNVNVPSGEPRGLAWCRLGNRVYGDRVVKRRSPRGRLYYWVNGGPEEAPTGRDTDIFAIRRHLVSVTPLSMDLTDDAVYGTEPDF